MRTLSAIPTRPRSRGAPGGTAGRRIDRHCIVIRPAPPSPQRALARPGGMRTNSRPRGLAVAARPAAANPRIEITPSVAQYKQLCRDLAKLRKIGAPSHTAAIVAAVHAAAAGDMLGHVQNKQPGGAMHTPPARQQEVQS